MRLTPLIILLFLLCRSAAADSAWIAELSGQQEQSAQAHSIDVWVPAGEYATVGVYGSDMIKVEPPPGVRADTFVIWYETRTIFQNRPDERTEAIPYYLPSRKWLAPHKSHPAWAVRLYCDRPGNHVVPIKCRNNTVTATLRVTPAVPPSDCGFGFYINYQAYSYGQHEPLYHKHMRDYGCNTFTAYDWTKDGSDLVRQMQSAAAAGLLDKRFPVLVLPGSPPGTVIPAAINSGRGSDDWPELIRYNHDEPSREKEASVRAFSKAVHDAELRTATAISASSAFLLGDCLDIWIVHMDSVNDKVRELCRRLDAEWWSYNCSLRGTNAPLHRYYTGVWTWKTRPRVNLLWAYQHGGHSSVMSDGSWNALRVHEHALGAPDGPMSTVGLEGVRDGITDYRVLRQLELLMEQNPRHDSVPQIANWLQSISDRIDTQFWPEGRRANYSDYYWDVPDTAVPPLDGAEVRRQALHFIDAMQSQPTQ